MVTRELILYLGNTMVLEMRGLKNSTTGHFENGASVSVTLKNGGSPIASPLSMAYVPGSRGTYRATLPSSVAATEGGSYTAEVVATGPGGSRGEWRLPVRAQHRDR